MSGITAVHLGESGAKVATLHEGLIFLIRNQRGMVKQTRTAMEKQLAPDLVAKTFGTATAGLVGIFQYQIRKREKDIPKEVKAKFAQLPLLPADAGTGNGDVDDLTAEALNWLVAEARAHAGK
jgi:hypothetical protein